MVLQQTGLWQPRIGGEQTEDTIYHKRCYELYALLYINALVIPSSLCSMTIPGKNTSLCAARNVRFNWQIKRSRRVDTLSKITTSNQEGCESGAITPIPGYAPLTGEPDELLLPD